MRNKRLGRNILIMVAGVALLAATTEARADRGRGKGRDRGHGKSWSQHDSHSYKGRRGSFPKLWARTIIHSGFNYHYYSGHFYRSGPYGYVSVSAPLGAVVAGIPLGYTTIMINGTVYYCYNNTYYLRRGWDFVVVAPPVYSALERPGDAQVLARAADTDIPVANTSETFSVSVSNSNGSYTSVRLTRTENGFTGPQGEYYPQFPSVEQLSVMYGK